MNQIKKNLQETVAEFLKSHPEEPKSQVSNNRLPGKKSKKDNPSLPRQSLPQKEPNNDEQESLLQHAQRCWPLKSTHWAKMETLSIQQAILLFYEIEPSTANPFSDPLFGQFVREGDKDHLWDLIKSSLKNGTLVLDDNGLIITEKFCSWLAQKEFPIPKPFSQIDFSGSSSPIVLRGLKDVQKIDFNKLPMPVLKSLGANCIVQMRRRANQKKNRPTKISDAINAISLQKFFDDVITIEDQTIGDDTIREYVETQFDNIPQ